MSKRNEAADPLQLWRDWVDQAERRWNAVLNEVMSSEPFSQASGRMMEGLFGLQTSMNEATQRYFSALNLPTRADLLTVAERLSAIERRLGEIEERLPRGGGGAERRPAVRPKPKRTRKAAPAAKSAPAPKSAPAAKAAPKKRSRKPAASKPSASE